MTSKHDSNFITIALPVQLIKQIDLFVRNSEGIYLSRPHVVKVALKRFFENNGGENFERNNKNPK